jgi:hypothetical protein
METLSRDGVTSYVMEEEKTMRTVTRWPLLIDDYPPVIKHGLLGNLLFIDVSQP